MEASTVSREWTDEQLVAATRAGDDRAFEQLYGRYHRRIGAYVLGMVKDHQRAEDITQEVFISALRRMRQTDRAIAFKPWIYEIAKNACIDQFRRSRRAEEVSCDADDGVGATLVSSGPTPDMALQSKQQLADLQGAFGGLSEAHHRILVMRELEGMSYAEIGERLGMSKPSVESTLFRARKRLSEEYDELVSGERCLRVQGIIVRAESGRLGARDQRRMARHVSYCQPCRRAAALAGLGDLVPARTGVRAKIAGLLPLPAVLRERWLGIGGEGASRAGNGSGGGGGGGGFLSWAHALMPAAESGAGSWTKAVLTAATVAVAGIGANAVTDAGGSPERPASTVAGEVQHADPAAKAAASKPAAAHGAATTRTTKAAARRGGKRGARQARGRKAGAGRTAAHGASRSPQVGRTIAATGGGARPGGGGATGTVVGSPSTSGGGGGGGGGGAGGAVHDTVASATQPVTQATGGGTPTAPSLPAAPSVGDTSTSVPTVPDVTTAVDQTVQSTTQAVEQAVTQVTQPVTQATQPVTQAVQDTTTKLHTTLSGGG
ncbi:MAG TPA: sigma-70 family RNA polymerase sigma factor [Capillimicrobium sp.]|nr:sigma-70 family RNA polymerase sigma factor [Capillimicrobium sp.]